MAQFSLDVEFNQKQWMKNPALRANAGLERAGFNWRVALSRSHYPPINPKSRYRRTYLTADKANFHITIPGKEMEFGSTWYTPFLIFPMRRTGRPLWPGKREEVIDLLQKGFASGVREYQE